MKQADHTITDAKTNSIKVPVTLPTKAPITAPTASTRVANTAAGLQYGVVNGRLTGADWLPSPNFNARPKTKPLELSGSSSKQSVNESSNQVEHDIITEIVTAIVVHNISLPPNEFAQTDAKGLHYVKALFTNQLDWDAHPYFQSIRGMEVSAHVLIERCGAVTQFVNFNDRAWHAGRSSYLGRQAVNDFSIGIELEGSDFTQFTDAQYQALAEVIVAIYHAYPKTRRHLTGHSDIAPVRKTDPGDYFEWQRIRQLVSEHMQ